MAIQISKLIVLVVGLMMLFAAVHAEDASTNTLSADEKIRSCLAYGRNYMSPVYEYLSGVAHEKELNATAYGKKLAQIIIDKCQKGATEADLVLFEQHKFTLELVNLTRFDHLQVTREEVDNLLAGPDTFTEEELEQSRKVDKISAELRKEAQKYYYE